MSAEDPTDDGWVLIEDQIECLACLARERYEENSHKGQSWREDEARWHIYKAIDQLSVASYHYRNGTLRKYEENMADALNHMIMAMLTFSVDNGGCHPVMGGES